MRQYRAGVCGVVAMAGLACAPAWGQPAAEGGEAGGVVAAEVPPALPADVESSRAAALMMTNIVNQAMLVPGSDFVGRLAGAGNWLDAPEMKAAFPERERTFRIPVATTPIFVGDNGAGNHITVVIHQPDESLFRAVLGQTVRLEPITDEAKLAEIRAAMPSELASEAVGEGNQYEAIIADIRAGTMWIGHAPASFPEGARAIHFIADANPGMEGATGEGGAAPGPTFTMQDDGTIRLWNGSIITGDGSPEKPYEIGWELLVAAERVYQPRNGMTALPDWVRVFSDKHVRLTGHLLSPLMMDDTTQILLMRNQWDGCCVGVPPSPYDAVEVELAKPISLVREQLNYGTITGVLVVDPYLVNNWLVGLYIVDRAKVDSANAQNWVVPQN